jgi:hypothetical protein
MTDIKTEYQKLTDLCYKIHDIDLDALREDIKDRKNLQAILNPTRWIIDREAVRLLGILIHAAIKFHKAIKSIPLIPRKPPLE